MNAMNDPFFIAGAAMFAFGALMSLHAFVTKSALRRSVVDAITEAYRQGLIRGRSEGHAARRQMEKSRGRRAEGGESDQLGGKEQGHD